MKWSAAISRSTSPQKIAMKMVFYTHLSHQYSTSFSSPCIVSALYFSHDLNKTFFLIRLCLACFQMNVWWFLLSCQSLDQLQQVPRGACKPHFCVTKGPHSPRVWSAAASSKVDRDGSRSTSQSSLCLDWRRWHEVSATHLSQQLFSSVVINLNNWQTSSIDKEWFSQKVLSNYLFIFILLYFAGTVLGGVICLVQLKCH